LEGGEAVINKRNTATFAPLLSKINSFNDNGLNFNNNSFIDYDLLASKINDKKVYVVDRDMTDRQSKSAKIVNRAKI
jgi:L-rhamnose isomerase